MNDAPINGLDNDLFYFLADAKIPHSRLHDTGGAYGKSVFVEFFEEFLKFISREDHKCPFDFFSWHSYASSENNFIDLCEGESAQIAFEKKAEFDGITVYGYNIERIEL